MKGYYGLSILCAVFLFGAVLVSPTFADKNTFADKIKVDDAELAKANASVTGVSVKDKTNDIEKDVRDQERLQASGNYDKGADVSPSVSKESVTEYQNISGQTTSNSGFRGMNMSITGSINAVKPH